MSESTRVWTLPEITNAAASTEVIVILFTTDKTEYACLYDIDHRLKRVFGRGLVKAELDTSGSKAVFRLTVDTVIRELRRQIYKSFFEALVDACPLVRYCKLSALDFLCEIL